MRATATCPAIAHWRMVWPPARLVGADASPAEDSLPQEQEDVREDVVDEGSRLAELGRNSGT